MTFVKGWLEDAMKEFYKDCLDKSPEMVAARAKKNLMKFKREEEYYEEGVSSCLWMCGQ